MKSKLTQAQLKALKKVTCGALIHCGPQGCLVLNDPAYHVHRGVVAALVAKGLLDAEHDNGYIGVDSWTHKITDAGIAALEEVGI